MDAYTITHVIEPIVGFVVFLVLFIKGMNY